MYINFDSFFRSELEPSDIYYLVAAKQVEKRVLETLPDDVLKRLEESSLVTYIKGKANEDVRLKLRLSNKGKKLLNTILTEPIASDEEDKLFTWLSNYYIEKNKEIGNPNRVKKYLAWFKHETGIQKNNLVKLFIDFLKDEYVDEASKVLEFTLFYPKKFTSDRGKTICYEAKPDIHDSWLYKHYLKNKERLDNSFEIYD